LRRKLFFQAAQRRLPSPELQITGATAAAPDDGLNCLKGAADDALRPDPTRRDLPDIAKWPGYFAEEGPTEHG